MTRIDVSAVLLAGISLLYPLLAALAVRSWGPGWVVVILCGLIAVRGLFGFARGIPSALTYGLLAVAALIALIALWDRELSVRLYPACMNAAMLIAFALTLRRGPSMIERFARLAEPNLPESGVRYTRTVTWVWVVFFLINGAIATWTALYADWDFWTLYNGLIAYLAMGALFAGEFIVRQFVRKREEPAK
ncbi:MAG: hypothetical protein WDM79_03345 [Terricaulis sp.]